MTKFINMITVFSTNKTSKLSTCNTNTKYFSFTKLFTAVSENCSEIQANNLSTETLLFK